MDRGGVFSSQYRAENSIVCTPSDVYGGKGRGAAPRARFPFIFLRMGNVFHPDDVAERSSLDVLCSLEV